MKKAATMVAVCLVLSCILASESDAQQSATANLSGRISGPASAVVAGAQVKATQKATSVERETTTRRDHESRTGG